MEPKNPSSSSDITKPGFNPGASSIGKAATSAHSAIEGAASRARPSIDRAASIAHDATDKLSGAASKATDWFNDKTSQVSEAEKKLMADTCKYVGENPLKALGMAVVAGAILARIL